MHGVYEMTTNIPELEKLSLEMSHIARQITDLQIQYRKIEDKLIKKIQEAKQNARNKNP